MATGLWVMLTEEKNPFETVSLNYSMSSVHTRTLDSTNWVPKRVNGGEPDGLGV